MTSVTEELTQTLDEAKLDEYQPGRSYLIADVGSATTTVTLYDIVEGQYRLVGHGSSQTTSGSPWYDITRGMQQAISQISDATGRTLLNDQGNLLRPRRPHGVGVDEFGATISVAPPLRVLVAGLLEDVSVASARRALESVPAQEVDSFCVTDKRDRTAQFLAMLEQPIDVILLVGGTDGGADKQMTTLFDTIAIGLGLMEDVDRPTIIYAGNADLRNSVEQSFGELTEVYLAENIRPEIDKERLDHVIGLLTEMYLAKKVGQIRGSDGLQEWSSIPVGLTPHSFVGISEFFAALYEARILCLDVGRSQLTVATAEPGDVNLLIFSDLAVGEQGLGLELEQELGFLSSWSPKFDEDSIRDYFKDKSIKQASVPLTVDSFRLEQGHLSQLVGQAIRHVARSWKWEPGWRVPEIRSLILRGSVLTNSPKPKLTILALLNALQPIGVFEIIADKYSVLAAMGLLAPLEPEMVIQVLNSGVLDRWGWVVVPSGRSRSGDSIIEVRIESEGVDNLRMKVTHGSLEVFPLPTNRQAVVTLVPASGIDIGHGRGRTRKIKVLGASIGLVVDARGRPVPDLDKESRREQLAEWMEAVGA